MNTRTAQPAATITPVDLRLVPGAFAAWGAAWWAPVVRPVVVWTFAGGCAIGAAALMWRVRRRGRVRGHAFRSTTAVALVCCAAGGLSAVLHAQDQGPVRALAADNTAVTVRLTVVGDPSVGVPKVHGPTLGTASVRVPARIERVERVGTAAVRSSATRVRTPVTVLATGAEARSWAGLLPSTGV
ncbi:MAG: hypothetical protein HOV68_01350, partial [Streptomycetaceae bacterium]|nr:hypothetical protein [Streptomycetaceae bacterium]